MGGSELDFTDSNAVLPPDWSKKRPVSLGIADACIHRVEWGEEPMRTLDAAIRQVEHPLTGVKRECLVTIIAYLSCQVVGLRHARDADAELALQQITGIVDERRRRVALETARS